MPHCHTGKRPARQIRAGQINNPLMKCAVDAAGVLRNATERRRNADRTGRHPPRGGGKPAGRASTWCRQSGSRAPPRDSRTSGRPAHRAVRTRTMRIPRRESPERLRRGSQRAVFSSCTSDSGMGEANEPSQVRRPEGTRLKRKRTFRAQNRSRRPVAAVYPPQTARVRTKSKRPVRNPGQGARALLAEALMALVKPSAD